METDFFDEGGSSRSPALVREVRDDADVLHVFGELDLAAVSDFEAALVRAVSIGRALVVDLRGCTYIEAVALGVLIRARAALGGFLRVEIADGSIVHRVFEITGLAHDVVFEAGPRPYPKLRLAPPR